MARILYVCATANLGDKADWCHCCNCGSDILIDVCGEICPICGKTGKMMFAGDGEPVELSDIKDRYDEVKFI